MRVQRRYILPFFVLLFAMMIPALQAQDTEIPEGGTLIFASGFGVDIFNPVITTEECRSCLWIFDSLVELAPNMSPAPNLAESWENNEEGTVFTFTLRQDVTWHDGEAFDADDVIFTYNAWMTDDASIWREDFILGQDDDGEDQAIEIEKIDDYTVQFTLTRSDAQFLTKLAGYALIVPEHLLSGMNMSEATDFNQHPIGTGSLVFEEALSEQYARFSTNKSYWRGTPHIDQFIWAVIPDEDAQVIALANGEIDVIKNVYGPDMEQRILDLGDTTIHQLLGAFTRTVYFNQENFEPFQDKLVREAISYGFDRDAIVNAIYGAEGAVAHQLFNDTHWGFNPDVRVIEYDEEMAIAKLTEAGWEDTDGDGIVDKDGVPFAFTVTIENGRDPDAQAFQDYMGRIGIDVSIQAFERAVWYEHRDSGDWDVFIGWDGSALAEDSLSRRVTGGWASAMNPRIDELVEILSSSLDQQARIDAAQEVMAIIQEEAYSIPYSYYQSKIAVKNYIGGLQDPPTGADYQATGVFYHIEDLYIDQS